MSARVRLGAAVALAAVAALTAVLVVVGGSEADGARLAWAGEVTRFSPPGAEGDTIMQTRVRNTSLRDVDLTVDDVRVLTEDGRELDSSARFLAAFAHGLYPPDERDESQIGDFEKRRLGEIVTVRPGESVPVTLSWRGPGAERVDLGPAAVGLP